MIKRRTKVSMSPGIKKEGKIKIDKGKFVKMSLEMKKRIMDRSEKLGIAESALIRMAVSRFLDEDEAREENY